MESVRIRDDVQIRYKDDIMIVQTSIQEETYRAYRRACVTYGMSAKSLKSISRSSAGRPPWEEENPTENKTTIILLAKDVSTYCKTCETC